MRVPEKYRCNKFPDLYSDESYGNNGLFLIPHHVGYFWIIASEGGVDETGPWEHVSVSIKDKKFRDLKRTPTWEEMCKIKDIFWDEDDCVIQYHPPKSHYVSQHEYCLHLWKPVSFDIPVPASIMVGTKMKIK